MSNRHMKDQVEGAVTAEQYVNDVKRLVDERLIPAERRLEGADTIPEELAAIIRRSGLFGISIPRAYGGFGFSMEQQIRIMLELTRASVAYRSRISTTIGLGSQPIVANGTDEQRRRWLPGMAKGETLAAFALTEPSYGSDAASVETAAKLEDDIYVINGTKRYITNACEADVFVVMARTDPQLKGARGISGFIVPSDLAGINVGPVDKKMGQDGAPTSDVLFQNVRVPAAHLIGLVEGRGLKDAMSGINHARLHVAATCVGQGERLIQEMLRHTMDRKQFGKRLANHQMIQAMLAECRTEVLAARTMVLAIARQIDLGDPSVADISCAKLFGSEMIGRVADRAVQVFGGAGYIRGTAVERIYRDVRLFRLFEGTSEIQKLMIAKDMIRRREAGCVGYEDGR